MKPQVQSSLKIYSRLLQYLKPNRLYFAGAVLCMVGYALFNGLISFAAFFTARGFMGHEKVVINKLPHFHFDYPVEFPIFLVPIILIVVIVIRGLFEFGSNYFMSIVGLRAIMKLRDDIYEHIVKLSMDFFARKRTGELMSRVMNDVGSIQNAISGVLVDLVKEPLALIGIIPGVFTFGGSAAIIGLIVFPVVVIPINMLGKKLRKITHRINEAQADIHSVLQETLAGVRVVKAFNMEDREIATFHEANKRTFDYFRKTVLTVEIQRPVIEILAAVGAALAVWYAIQKHMPIEQFVSLIVALFLLYEPIKKLSRVNSSIQQSIASGERVFQILDAKSSVQEVPRPLTLGLDIREVTFDDVSFAYDEEPVLRDIRLRVKRGEMLALVGSSGAGKTTLVNLIPRFYDPTRGRVLINDTNLCEFSIRSLRDQIGIVSQETILFNTTVRENIAYGKPSASLDEIRRVAETAYAADFVEALPLGYDTMIGERGMTISGGERQRVAIARALLKNPPILILDEATSQLDTESEREVQKALDYLMEGRTVFVIAHRLSTVQRADRIVVLDEGRIVQIGRHEELIEQEGQYKKLYDLQFAV